jgi:hypothetical protein
MEESHGFQKILSESEVAHPTRMPWDRSRIQPHGCFPCNCSTPARQLHGDKATVDEQLYSGDEAAVVRRKKYDCFGQFIGCTDTAQWHAGG